MGTVIIEIPEEGGGHEATGAEPIVGEGGAFFAGEEYGLAGGFAEWLAVGVVVHFLNYCACGVGYGYYRALVIGVGVVYRSCRVEVITEGRPAVSSEVYRAVDRHRGYVIVSATKLRINIESAMRYDELQCFKAIVEWCVKSN